MDFNTWLAIGREHGYCSLPTCETHDGVPMSELEQDAWEEGEDPCVHVIRLYESPEHMEEVESNIPEWRK